MKLPFFWAYEPQSRKTTPWRFVLIHLITASVNFSHPCEDQSMIRSGPMTMFVMLTNKGLCGDWSNWSNSKEVTASNSKRKEWETKWDKWEFSIFQEVSHLSTLKLVQGRRKPYRVRLTIQPILPELIPVSAARRN